MSRVPASAPLLDRRAALALIGGATLAATVPAAGASAGAAERARLLARGINIPDWADRADGVAPSAEVLASLVRLGFTAVRLPIAAERLDPGGLVALRHNVATLIDAGLAVDLDLHDVGLSFADSPAEAEAAAVAAWERLADVCAGFPADRVFPELLNEPPMEAARWHDLRDRLFGLVRSACPGLTLIWGPARYQGIWELRDAPLPPDANAIVAVHYYTPMGFTHQCEDWSGSPFGRFSDLPFPASRKSPEVAALRERLIAERDREALAALDAEFAEPWTAGRIVADFRDLAAWSARTGTPAVLNEFGVLDFCVDPLSRAAWTRAVRTAAEQNGVGWLWWELDQGFGLLGDRRDAESFDGSVLEALMGQG